MSRLHHGRANAPDTYISWSRFITHLLVSWFAVQLSAIIFQQPYCTVWLTATALTCGCISWTASQFVHPQPYILPSPPYCIITSFILLWLRNLSLLLDTQTADGTPEFSKSQHLGIHCVAAFFVISELEFYRAYVHHRGSNDWRTSLKYCLYANLDIEFRRSRDFIGYGSTYPRHWEGFLGCETEPKDPQGVITIGLIKSTLLSLAIAYSVNGCFSYLIKRAIYPSSGPVDYVKVFRQQDILFKTENNQSRYSLAFFVLLRVSRQANYLAFWTVAGWIEKGVAWYNPEAESIRVAKLLEKSDLQRGYDPVRRDFDLHSTVLTSLSCYLVPSRDGDPEGNYRVCTVLTIAKRGPVGSRKVYSVRITNHEP